MDRIVWSSDIAGGFTDELLSVLGHLDEDEEMLRRIWISLDEISGGPDNAVLKQIDLLLGEVKRNVEMLNEKTADVRSGIYRSMELFESTEKHLVNLTRNDAITVQSRNGLAKPVPAKQVGHTVLVRGNTSRVDPGWFMDLAAGMHQTKKRG